MNIRESDLVGIGKKFQIQSSFGDEIVVIIHNDGRREIYGTDKKTDDMNLLLTLNDEDSRQVAGILGGMAYTPKTLESTEVAISDLTIEWYKVASSSPALSKSIGDLAIRKTTGAAIIAAIGPQDTIINPGPDYIIVPETTLVVAGKRASIRQFKDMFISH